MEHFIIFHFTFQDSLLFFLCSDLDDKGIVPYILPNRFRPFF